MKIGIIIFGIASIAAGILDLVWGEFEPAHQPIVAWGNIPGITILVYIAALVLIVAGAAILWPRTVHTGAAALTILFGIFILFPLPRLYTAPHYLGHRPAVYIGVLVSVCEQIILAVAAFIVWKTTAASSSLSPRSALLARWIFGICSVIFGLAHLVAVDTVVPMIPTWIPLGPAFWAILTGIAFVLAGLAIVSGVLDVLAARLLGLMLLIFSPVVLVPMIFASPHNHVAWGANAYNLAAAGSAWIVAACLASRRSTMAHGEW